MGGRRKNYEKIRNIQLLSNGFIDRIIIIYIWTRFCFIGFQKNRQSVRNGRTQEKSVSWGKLGAFTVQPAEAGTFEIPHLSSRMSCLKSSTRNPLRSYWSRWSERTVRSLPFPTGGWRWIGISRKNKARRRTAILRRQTKNAFQPIQRIKERKP